ncbi:MAG: hypothetical protein Edafosvirus1_84 [Edafosvirus sp.]|uniref:Uncharacterized protein n=1 Tax=Edafosvirus sp. TaxID=2487765 RepID=A0A3G4ZVV5_9VIRU|nr:MAG: hypothetical protein Edafosvirus1_84 [Edafosvirus sp.]
MINVINNILNKYMTQTTEYHYNQHTVVIHVGSSSTIEKVICATCNTLMEHIKIPGIKCHGVYAHMAFKHLDKDQFTCPLINEQWHKQAYELKMEISKTSSPTLTSILQKDLDYVLSTKTATKIIK